MRTGKANLTIKELKLHGDTANLIATITGLQGEISMWEAKQFIEERLAREIADKWFLEHGNEVMDKINANQILNSVILRLGQQMATGQRS